MSSEHPHFIKQNKWKNGRSLMESKTFFIPNISCGHCVMSIKNELSGIEGVSQVEGDPDSKKVTVAYDAPATLEKIKSALKEINYPAAD